MRPEKLRTVVPACVACSDGCGPVFQLSPSEYGKLLVLTLVIDGVVEYETLSVSIWISSDAENWGQAPVVSFPPKDYCGVYSILLNLATRPDIRHLRAHWRMQRWKNTKKELRFEFSIVLESSGARMNPLTHPPEHGKRTMKTAS